MAKWARRGLTILQLNSQLTLMTLRRKKSARLLAERELRLREFQPGLMGSQTLVKVPHHTLMMIPETLLEKKGKYPSLNH